MLAAYGLVALGQTTALAAEPLQMNSIALSEGLNGFALAVEGQGIASTKLQLYNLGGSLILEKEAMGNTLQFRAMNGQGETLANGVYLYVVTVRGYGGLVMSSKVQKLVILK